MVDFNWRFLRDLLQLEARTTITDAEHPSRREDGVQPAGTALWGWRCASIVPVGRPRGTRRDAPAAADGLRSRRPPAPGPTAAFR